MSIFFRKRGVAFLMALMLVLPLLAACGPSGNSTATDPTSVPPRQGQPTTVPATSAPKPTSAPAATSAPVATAAPQPTSAPTANAPAATVVPTAPTQAGGSTPLRTDNLEFGVVSHLYYTDRERVLTLTDAAGFNWVRQQVVWKDIEGANKNYAWGELDNIVNDVAAHNKKLLISIVQSPSFYNETNGLPQDPVSLGDFVEAMAKRYGDKISAYEIWNEQNLAHENGGHVTVDDAGHYVEILAESYKRIKAVSPNAYVLAGPPSSSGVNDPSIAVSDENYYKAMYSYKNGMIKNYFDAQAVHPGGSANPPDTMWPDNPSKADGWTNDGTFYFRHVEDVRRFMVENGVGDHQIWITEYGWATTNNTPGYEFGNQVTMQQQSDYIVGAMKLVNKKYRDDDGKSWVGAMFLWNMNFAVLWGAQSQPLHEQASFAILEPDWSPRPSFIAIQSYLAQFKKK